MAQKEICSQFCKSTALKLVFGDSVNSPHSIVLCSWSSTSITVQIFLQYTKSFSPEYKTWKSSWSLRKKHTLVSFWRRFHPLSSEPKNFGLFFYDFKSRRRWFNSHWVNRWGSQEDVLVSTVASSCCSFGTSVAAWCSDSSSTVRCVAGCGIGKSSLWGTDVKADGKFGYFTVCLDLLLNPLTCVIQK